MRLLSDAQRYGILVLKDVVLEQKSFFNNVLKQYFR
jgi:hypothetical protein